VAPNGRIPQSPARGLPQRHGLADICPFFLI
jgi:hypothetical protein